MLTYRGTPLKRVDRFKYLGLEYTGHPGMATMVETSVGQSKAGLDYAIEQVD